MTTYLELLRASGIEEAELASIVDSLDDRATHWEPYTPFDTEMQFFLWLTREEWQFLYCLSFAWEIAGEMSVELSGPGEELRAAAFRVECDTGYEFEGVTTNDEMKLVPKTPQALEPQNIAWVMMLVKDRMPDLRAHFPAAIEFAESHSKLTCYVQPLEAALSQAKADLERYKAIPPTPEERELLSQVEDAVKRETVVN